MRRILRGEVVRLQLSTGMIIGLFGGLGGALLTLAVQSWRDFSARRRQAAVIRVLLIHEMEMMWFDLTGSGHPLTTKIFSCRTDVWDTYRKQIPNLFSPDDVKTVYGAYYWAKEFQRHVAMDAPLDYMKESDGALKNVVAALKVLAGPQHTIVAGDTSRNRAK